MLACATVVLTASLAIGQVDQARDQLSDFDQFIGTWTYDGVLKEDVKGDTLDIDKGTDIVAKLTWKKILNGAAIQYDWQWGPEGGKMTRGRSLISWNPKEKRITSHDVNSLGSSSHGVMTFDKTSSTWTSSTKGVRSNGDEQSGVTVWALSEPNSLVLQGKDRKGGIITGDSPPYAFTKQND